MTQQEKIEQAAREITSRFVGEEDQQQSFIDFKNALIEIANWILSHQWISVDVDLPSVDEKCNDLSEDVIVRNEYGKVTTAWYSYSAQNWHLCYGEIQGDDLIHSKITHWMEIPHLPKGGKK